MKNIDKDIIWCTVQQGHKNLLPEEHAEELIKAHELIYGKNEVEGTKYTLSFSLNSENKDKNLANWIKLAEADQNKIWLL